MKLLERLRRFLRGPDELPYHFWPLSDEHIVPQGKGREIERTSFTFDLTTPMGGPVICSSTDAICDSEFDHIA